MTREELIAALEAAPGPSRELDARIGFLALPPEKHAKQWTDESGEWCTNGIHWPRYTASLDAAMTLVPEEIFVSLTRYTDGWYALIALRSESTVSFRGEQKPAAIAICIAALKALGT